MQLQKINVTLQISTSKYYDIDEIHNVEILGKNKYVPNKYVPYK